jgi:hypothetical protein
LKRYRDAIAAVAQAPGTRPVAWSGPDFQETMHTPHLLAAAGIRNVCDWGNDEQPYKMTPQTGELYALGVHAYLDDNSIHLHGRRTINEVNRCGASGSTGCTPTGRRPAG